MIYANVPIRDPLKQDLALDFYRKKNKYINILTETHIKHDQIFHIRNNWLGPIFLSPGSSHTKGFIAQLSFSASAAKLLSLITEFSVLCPLKA